VKRGIPDRGDIRGRKGSGLALTHFICYDASHPGETFKNSTGRRCVPRHFARRWKGRHLIPHFFLKGGYGYNGDVAKIAQNEQILIAAYDVVGHCSHSTG